jgi:hypothetical protein
LGRAVVGIYNLNAYYDPKLKQARLDELAQLPYFRFERIDLAAPKTSIEDGINRFVSWYLQ